MTSFGCLWHLSDNARSRFEWIRTAGFARTMTTSRNTSPFEIFEIGLARDGARGEHGLNKTNAKLFEDIDEAMDAYIKPIIHYDQNAPEPLSVEDGRLKLLLINVVESHRDQRPV
jgi:hypothetical protein